MQKDVDAHIPNYPNLPSKLICLLHNVTLHVCFWFPLFFLMKYKYETLVTLNTFPSFWLFFRLMRRQMKSMLRWHSSLSTQ